MVCLKDGRALQFAGQELRRDRGLVLIAVTSNGIALRIVEEEFRRDEEAKPVKSNTTMHIIRTAMGRGLCQP
eukprot:5545297-Amphidinium_carterae.1